jgi:hypothetical protein
MAKPLRDLVEISGDELARWIRITTPNDRPPVIRVLEMAAEIGAGKARRGNGEANPATTSPRRQADAAVIAAAKTGATRPFEAGEEDAAGRKRPPYSFI